MAKKAVFPRVVACENIVDIRHLLSKVRWRSAEYNALINHWRALCREEIDFIKLRTAFMSAADIADTWRKLYEDCPSGSLEEFITLGLWQHWMPNDGQLMRYRQRVILEAKRAAEILGISV